MNGAIPRSHTVAMYSISIRLKNRAASHAKCTFRPILRRMSARHYVRDHRVEAVLGDARDVEQLVDRGERAVLLAERDDALREPPADPRDRRQRLRVGGVDVHLAGGRGSAAVPAMVLAVAGRSVWRIRTTPAAAAVTVTAAAPPRSRGRRERLRRAAHGDDDLVAV